MLTSLEEDPSRTFFPSSFPFRRLASSLLLSLHFLFDAYTDDHRKRDGAVALGHYDREPAAIDPARIGLMNAQKFGRSQQNNKRAMVTVSVVEQVVVDPSGNVFTKEVVQTDTAPVVLPSATKSRASSNKEAPKLQTEAVTQWDTAPEQSVPPAQELTTSLPPPPPISCVSCLFHLGWRSPA